MCRTGSYRRQPASCHHRAVRFVHAAQRTNRGRQVQESDVRTDINKLFDFMMVDDTLRQQDRAR